MTTLKLFRNGACDLVSIDLIYNLSNSTTIPSYSSSGAKHVLITYAHLYG